MKESNQNKTQKSKKSEKGKRELPNDLRIKLAAIEFFFLSNKVLLKLKIRK